MTRVDSWLIFTWYFLLPGTYVPGTSYFLLSLYISPTYSYQAPVYRCILYWYWYALRSYPKHPAAQQSLLAAHLVQEWVHASEKIGRCNTDRAEGMIYLVLRSTNFVNVLFLHRHRRVIRGESDSGSPGSVLSPTARQRYYIVKCLVRSKDTVVDNPMPCQRIVLDTNSRTHTSQQTEPKLLSGLRAASSRRECSKNIPGDDDT